MTEHQGTEAEPRLVRLLVVSDLHYKDHKDGKACRPAASEAGVEYDPIAALIDHLKSQPKDSRWQADYLLCPGDIPDKSNKEAFNAGWARLRELKEVVSARHLIAATGNHEVISRPDNESHDHAGNAELALDPFGYLQSYSDYPSSIWNGPDRQWVYWGRGYEFIEDENLLLLLVNSSHFHVTTRENEFDRGRIGDISIKLLRDEIKERVANTEAGVFVVLLHHHPINHENLDFPLGRIDMFNGSKLIEVLSESGVAWLVIHGHKHHGRLVLSQGDGCQAVVLAAGSAGANLTGKHGIQTRLQAYLVEVAVADPRTAPKLAGRLSALSWIDNSWSPATRQNHGIPDGAGFSFPMIDVAEVAEEIKAHLTQGGYQFLSWEELVKGVPRLGHLLPGQLKHLRRELGRVGVSATWDTNTYFPEDVAP